MTALTVQESNTVNNLLAGNIKRIQSVLPSHMTPERMCRIAYMAIEKNPALAQCSQFSLLNAVLEAASLGLEIGGARPLAHLLPYKRSVTLIIDYKGFIDLAQRSGQIKTFYFQPVYSKDEFSYAYGLNPKLNHVPSTEDDRGELVYAYAVVKLVSGGSDFEVVDKATAMKAKAKSPARDSAGSPWNKKDEEYAMWCKTAVRRLAKRVPMSAEFQRAAYIDEMGDSGYKQDFNNIPLNIPLDDLPNTADDLTKKLKGEEKPSDDGKFPCPTTGEMITKQTCEDALCTKATDCPAYKEN
jgi:recombination protein RecT